MLKVPKGYIFALVPAAFGISFVEMELFILFVQISTLVPISDMGEVLRAFGRSVFNDLCMCD